MADDRRTGPVADLLGEPIPRSDGLRLEATPGQAHQVERGQEVSIEPVSGVEDAVLAQQLTVAEEHVLEVRRARLRGADMEQHSLAGGRHLAHLGSFFQSWSTNIRTANVNTTSSPWVRVGPAEDHCVGTTTVGSPTTG